MKTVRYSVFETNSSSVHALTYTPKEKWDRFVAGDPNLVWLQSNPMAGNGPWNKTDNIVDVHDYADYLMKDDPEGIGKLSKDFVVEFIKLSVKYGDGCGPLDSLMYHLNTSHVASSYLKMKELSDNFTSDGDYDYDKSGITEVEENGQIYVKADAVWFDG